MKKDNRNQKNAAQKEPAQTGSMDLALGLSLGTLIGIRMDNIGLGMMLGVAVGLGAGSAAGLRKRKEREEDREKQK